MDTLNQGVCYGVVATAVQPNAKCAGCLHYEPQRGESGLCQVGLRPWNCGAGDSPSIGYAPLASTGPDLKPGALTEPAQADALLMPYAEMAKGVLNDMMSSVRSSCQMHQSHNQMRGTINAYAPLHFTCTCKDVSDFTVAKSVYAQIPNRVRAKTSIIDVTAFVNNLRKTAQ